jgi:hypothetical protein
MRYIMPIKVVELTSVDGKRFSHRGEKVRNVRIDTSSTVTLISEESDSEANIEFRFTASYGGMGVIKVEGSILFEGDASNITQSWNKTGNMPDEVASEVHTAIMRTCMPEAVMISRTLKLPPPIPIPPISFGKKKKGKTASSGMEVA